MSMTNDEVNAKASEIANKISQAVLAGENSQDLWNLTFGAVKVLILELADEMSEWRPVETAPKDTRVIMYFSDGDMMLGHAAEWVHDEGDDYWVTHWMPLPESSGH
jgi:hypothetical protein